MKSAIRKVGVVGVLALTMLWVTAAPAMAGTGVTLAEAKPWHYWIAWVILISAIGVLVVALPVGYYLRVYRLKHPRR